MNRRSAETKSWWRRNAHLRSSLETIAGILLALAAPVWLALNTAPDDRLYTKAHYTLALVSLVGLLGLLLTKPASMWKHLVSAARAFASGVIPDGDEALAALVAGLLVLLIVISLTVIDWKVVGGVRWLGAVLVVNLAIVARGLWAKYGSQSNERNLPPE